MKEQLDTQSFVKMAGIGNVFETETSHLAEEKSKNSEVKRFASEMVKDHTKAQSELESLVKSEKHAKLHVPTKLEAEDEQRLKQLRAASGADFDRSYKQMQIDAHQHAINLFQHYSKQGDDAKLKAWAQNMIPTLQHHLSQAKSIKVN